MDHAWHRYLHIDGWYDSWTVLPPLHCKWVTSDLWPKALQVLHHLLRPICGELIMPVDVHGQVIVEASLAMLKMGGDVEKLVIDVVGVNRRKLCQPSRCPGCAGTS